MKTEIVKVCGMGDPLNIQELSQLPVDYMGAIFYPKSPRFIGDRDDTAEAFKSVPQKVVGVFVNASLEELSEASEKFHLCYLQLHGSESPEFCREAARIRPIFKAFGLKEGFDFDQLKEYEDVVELFIFDTSCKEHGGSGKKFNWDILKQYKGSTPFLLSGGITSGDEEKVQAVSHDRCIGVDLNSGFESAPAMKKIDALRTFIENMKEGN